jgi:hypothetical protein
MLQCATPGCHVRQHADCLALPPATQAPYFCDLCRVKAADPFWEVLDTSIMPPARVRLTNRQVQVGGSREVGGGRLLPRGARCQGRGAAAGRCGVHRWGAAGRLPLVPLRPACA